MASLFPGTCDAIRSPGHFPVPGPDRCVSGPRPFPLSYTKRVVFVYEWGSEGGSYTKRVVFVYGNGEALEFSRQKRGSPGHFAPNSSFLRPFGP